MAQSSMIERVLAFDQLMEMPGPMRECMKTIAIETDAVLTCLYMVYLTANVQHNLGDGACAAQIQRELTAKFGDEAYTTAKALERTCKDAGAWKQAIMTLEFTLFHRRLGELLQRGPVMVMQNDGNELAPLANNDDDDDIVQIQSPAKRVCVEP